jgi:hypothetical protein
MARTPHIPFHFHALAHALSGEFRHPGRVLIDAQASASLPSIGGHARANAEKYFCQDFIRFKQAHTHVTGRWNEHRTEAHTHATTVIYDLNILDVVTADRIEANLSSVHKVGERVGRISAGGSSFHNLRINGHAVKVGLRHNHLADCIAGEDFKKAVETDRNSGKMAGHREGAALCSLVEEIETNLPDVNLKQHVITVEGFGKIFLAEIFAVEGERTLTMLRLELGSPHVAELTAAEANTNGQPSPPTP